jgi:hypothetical protein
MTKHTHYKNHIVTRVLTFIVFLALAILLFLFGRSVKDNVVSAPVVESPKIEQLVDMSNLDSALLTSESKYGKVIGSYPVFKNVDSSFNDKIRNNITIAQAEFENNAKENWQARLKTKLPNEKISEFPEDGEMYFGVETEYVQVNSKYISILIRINGFSGGAHGYENLYSYNYDVVNQKELVLKDFFPNDTNYLKTVSDFSKSNLIEQFTNNVKRADFATDKEWNDAIKSIELEMIEDGTKPLVDNFSIFTYVPGMLTIYFNQYQVAPYVYGSQKVKMAIQ